MTLWRPAIERFPGPRYLAIARALAEDAASGALAGGQRLPTHRQLARRLGVTVGTVTRAYAEAERLGLISGEVGRGTFVRQRGGLAQPKPAEDGAAIDLTLNVWPADPEDGELLRDTFAALAKRADTYHLLGYQSHGGALTHREAAAAWITRQHRLPVAADQVILTAGGQHALCAALSAIFRPGEALAVDHLTWPGIKAVAETLNIPVRTVPADAEGMLPDALAALARSEPVRAVYLMPTLHNPTAATMREPRRQALAAAAAASDLMIVEDDVYGFLDHNAPAPVAVHAPERTIFMASTSKCFGGGLRLGFLAVPDGMVGRTIQAVRSTTWMAPAISAEVARLWIDTGDADRLAERRREKVRQRQQKARAILGLPRHGGGEMTAMHMWLPVTGRACVSDIVVDARARGVVLVPPEVFLGSGRGEAPRALRICLSAPPSDAQLEQALTTLAGLIRESASHYLSVV
ncbi:MAG: PLP-dependent aminotransferase family protein [Thalassobaculales bacterium]